MSGHVSQAIEDLRSFEFDPLMPKPVNSIKWHEKKTDDKGEDTLVENPDLKENFKNMLKSETIRYTKKISKYKADMELLHGIIFGNLDINVRILIEFDTTFMA